MKWLRRRKALAWGAEVAGVLLVALGAGAIYLPAAALVAGLYLVVVANSGGE